jgi:hypothetical protein
MGKYVSDFSYPVEIIPLDVFDYTHSVGQPYLCAECGKWAVPGDQRFHRSFVLPRKAAHYRHLKEPFDLRHKKDSRRTIVHEVCLTIYLVEFLYRGNLATDIVD